MVKIKPYDKIFAEIIKSGGECEAKGVGGKDCSAQLQTAHIVTRGRAATRTDLRNAYALCFSHHRYFHDYPREFSHFITETWAQEFYDAVYQKSITPTKVNWKERTEFLKDILLAVKGGELTLAEARKYENG